TTSNIPICQSATSTTIGFNPSLSDHFPEDESDADDQWNEQGVDEHLQDDLDTILSDTSLTPSTSISQQPATVMVPKDFRRFFSSERVKNSDGTYEVNEFRVYECTLDLVPHPYPHNGESIAKLI
ncbi:hypothetical protein BGZ75_000913, partial [Mortierella antarctica]